MKIWIIGLAKSGTSILTYMIANAMHRAKVSFEPLGRNGISEYEFHQEICNSKKLVTKNIFYPTIDNKINEISKLYEKKIWIIRDPRDRIISDFFYGWYRFQNNLQGDYERLLLLVKQKEKSPSAIPFLKFFEDSKERKILSHELILYNNLVNNINNLDKNWLVIKYEDIIDENFEALNNYLGFKVNINTNVPQSIKRIVRTKNYGNWRYWFTPEDVCAFKNCYNPYLESLGYNKEDWDLFEVDHLPSENGSDYMQKLACESFN